MVEVVTTNPGHRTWRTRSGLSSTSAPATSSRWSSSTSSTTSPASSTPPGSASPGRNPRVTGGDQDRLSQGVHEAGGLPELSRLPRGGAVDSGEEGGHRPDRTLLLSDVLTQVNLKLTAEDRDQGINGIVRYHIVAGNQEGHFGMDEKTGQISLNYLCFLHM